MKIMDFEQFAASRGASRLDFGDAGLHNPAGHIPERTWKRMRDAQAARDANLAARRADLYREFEALKASGEIREPTSDERLAATAEGEGPAAEAARRVIEKRKARRLVKVGNSSS